MEELALGSRPEELARLWDWLQELARRWQWSAELLSTAQLVLEELVQNAARHGGGEPGIEAISIHLAPETEPLRIEVAAPGRPFDPRQAPAPDLGAPLWARPVGGLGLHLVRELAEELSYRRDGGVNVVTVAVRARGPDRP